jgi:WD40 repeat protein
MKYLFTAAVCLATVCLYAQPDTDIYLLTLHQTEEAWHFTRPVNITPRKGYDNQPSFSPDGRYLYYVSILSDNQSDIYRYDRETGTSVRAIHSPGQSEYSPQVTPDGKSLSVVTVEPDSAQRLWIWPLAGGPGKVLMPRVDSVGYYVWYDTRRIWMFVLGEPFTLRSAHVRRQREAVQAREIGRGIQRAPGGGISYVSKADSTWTIRVLHPETGHDSLVVASLPGVEDYAWTPDGALLSGLDGVLYRFRPGIDEGWLPVGQPGVGDFYRLTLSPDGTTLALVVYRGERP